jgi:transposase
MQQQTKQNVNNVGIDLAKKVFHLVGTDTTGKILWRKRLTRNALMPFMAQLPPVTIGMEACGGAHYWARQFRQQGDEVKLMAPQFVKPYVKSNKNDRRDAEAIAEAVTRATMRFVPIKEVDQQDIQALHRIRSRAADERAYGAGQRDARPAGRVWHRAAQRGGPIPQRLARQARG